ncbi:hypothetical protein EDD16DRAFT_1527161 [Pisolithus croceorrhizus]|nr:hypothetical protein EDD16DRAFT_1527161 [Pisolithus croceorrhizus]
MPDTFVSHTTGHGRHCAEMEGSRVRVQNLTCHWVVHLSPRDISDPMIEPTHPVIFRVFSPPPRGLELERDPTAAECPNALLEMLKKGMPLTDASKMHTSNTVIRTLPAEAMPRSKILNPEPNPGLVLPGMPLPLCAPVTGFVPTTSKEFCKHQKAIRSHDDCVLWFSSMDSEPMGTPSSSPSCYSHALQDGDLFVHSHNHGCQTWIWGESGWMPVQEAGSGEPSWVTGKTMAMYRVKNRKCHP